MTEAVYIHIPFCEKICSYCDFCKVLYNEKLVDKYLDSLENEIKKRYLGEKIKTLYIGGGTPSSLNITQLIRLFEITNIFDKESLEEFTIEANFESTTFEKLCKFLEKETNPKIGLETKIKLIGDKDNKPKFPYLLSVFEVGGDAVITNNCIGKNLGFTAYELEQKKKIESAKPTKMPDLDSTVGQISENNTPIKEDESDDLDFNL